jgi:hypothetical protein
MKLPPLFLTLSLSLISATAIAGDLSSPYSPSRAEWLQASLHNRITQTTDLWKRRVGVVVAVFPAEQQVSVVLSSSNGQPDPTEQEMAFYVRHIEELVKGTLSNYEWASDLRVAVHFH